MYDALVTALKALTGISFTEDGWATRPHGDFGSVQIDFEAKADRGDDRKIDRAFEGSVDLFLHKPNRTKLHAVETALENNVGSSWQMNSRQYETDTGLTHYEWVFQIDEEPEQPTPEPAEGS